MIRVAPALALFSALAVSLPMASPSSAQGLILRDKLGNVNQISTGVIERSNLDLDAADELNRTEKTVDIRAFTRLVVRVPSDLVFRQGSPNRVELKAPNSVLRRIETSQNGTTLTIDSRGGFQSNGRARIIITGSSLQDVDLQGDMKADLSGLRGAKFRLKASGTVDVVGRGEVSYCVIRISGASSANLKALHCNVADLNVQGASDAQLHATDRVTGLVAGASELEVSGQPADRRVTTNGAVDISYR